MAFLDSFTFCSYANCIKSSANFHILCLSSELSLELICNIIKLINRSGVALLCLRCLATLKHSSVNNRCMYVQCMYLIFVYIFFQPQVRADQSEYKLTSCSVEVIMLNAVYS